MQDRVYYEQSYKPSLSTFLSMVAPILLLQPPQYVEFLKKPEKMIPRRSIEYVACMLVVANLGLKLCHSEGRKEVAESAIANTMGFGAKKLFEYTAPIALTFTSNVVSRLFDFGKTGKRNTETLIAEYQNLFEKDLSDLNIDHRLLFKDKSEAELVTICDRLKCLQSLLRAGGVSWWLVNLFTGEQLLLIVNDSRNINLSHFTDDRLEPLLRLSTYLKCINIPMKILNRFAQFHDENFLNFCIKARNMEVFDKAISKPIFSYRTVGLIAAECIYILFSLTSGRWLINEVLKRPVEKGDGYERSLVVIFIITLCSFSIKYSVYDIIEAAKQIRFLSANIHMLISAASTRRKEIIDRCLYSNPNLIHGLNSFYPKKAKEFIEDCLINPQKLAKFLKNADHNLLLDLRALFPEMNAFQNVRSTRELLHLADKSSNEVKKNTKVIYQLAYSKRYNFFSGLPREVRSLIIAKTGDARIHDELFLQERFIRPFAKNNN